MKKIFCIAFMCMTVQVFALDFTATPTTDADWTAFLDAVALVESGGKTDIAITDVNGKRSVGCLQIQQPYLTDSKMGYTLDDMKDKAKAYEVAKAYLTRYGSAYTRKTGKPATFEILARIHNGGPSGWKKAATLPYANKVKAKLP